MVALTLIKYGGFLTCIVKVFLKVCTTADDGRNT